jgi:hypothetical protein
MFPGKKEESLLETLRAYDYSTEEAISHLLGENGEGEAC